MKFKNKIEVILTIIIFIFLLITCTENGVECSLTGKWLITDFDHDDIPVDVDDVDGILEITYNDTYDLDMEYKIYNNKIEFDDYGTLKACSFNKFIQFFSDDDDGSAMHGSDKDSLNCRYSINGSNLRIYNDDFTMDLIKLNQ